MPAAAAARHLPLRLATGRARVRRRGARRAAPRCCTATAPRTPAARRQRAPRPQCHGDCPSRRPSLQLRPLRPSNRSNGASSTPRRAGTGRRRWRARGRRERDRPLHSAREVRPVSGGTSRAACASEGAAMAAVRREEDSTVDPSRQRMITRGRHCLQQRRGRRGAVTHWGVCEGSSVSTSHLFPALLSLVRCSTSLSDVCLFCLHACGCSSSSRFAGRPPVVPTPRCIASLGRPLVASAQADNIDAAGERGNVSRGKVGPLATELQRRRDSNGSGGRRPTRSRRVDLRSPRRSPLVSTRIDSQLVLPHARATHGASRSR